MLSGFVYYLLASIVRIALFFWHPVFHVIGREHVPKEGRLVICANHSGMADPIWVIFALKLGHAPRIMAKKEAMRIPFLGWLLGKFGVFGVDRGTADIQAIKTGLRCLQQEQQLLIFPEGTRMKGNRRPEPKRGAVTLAARADAPILPVFLTYKRRPFSPLTCVIGEPFVPQFAGMKPTEEELQAQTEALMDRIYNMEDAR